MSSERQEDNIHSPWWGEHIHRYAFAAPLVNANSRVLDLACGEGFGTNYIREKCQPQYIVGGDLSQEAIELCRKKYPEAEFKVLDGTQTGFAAGNFSHILSFETIEHTTQYREMLAEFSRLLQPQGRLVLSTPNIKVNSPDGVVRNPYHTQEFTYDELDGIIKPFFSAYTIYGQQYTRYKNRKGPGKLLAQPLEKFLYLRGIRKMPLPLKNGIFKLLIGKKFYPDAADYSMTSEKEEILKCKTFYAVCTK